MTEVIARDLKPGFNYTYNNKNMGELINTSLVENNMGREATYTLKFENGEEIVCSWDDTFKQSSKKKTGGKRKSRSNQKSKKSRKNRRKSSCRR